MLPWNAYDCYLLSDLPVSYNLIVISGLTNNNRGSASCGWGKENYHPRQVVHNSISFEKFKWTSIVISKMLLWQEQDVFLQSSAIQEGGTLQEEAGFEMKISGAVATLVVVVVEAMAEMSSGTKPSFPFVQRVLAAAMWKPTDVWIRMRTGVKVGWTKMLFLHSQRDHNLFCTPIFLWTTHPPPVYSCGVVKTRYICRCSGFFLSHMFFYFI